MTLKILILNLVLITENSFNQWETTSFSKKPDPLRVVQKDTESNNKARNTR